ncbi:hypothetical protein P152DRAFT_465744 [Eremomyces bilateralis CBS 781.70]|uniref:Origin recognition complex subunit n=1 Tax=Eremomyces bilateralis CBS 781.70 TaxID=1392243 RepID=A0A6G1G7V2_9PEZI|nr:uncharacterized protein P152DRAFT_465744 [Eremomyces bilateralis CBS 781.70]KAF1814016.1 hypothetical protein P152DRAFT_465744 [Eremomyces bilateralis CBS 781.70]
MEHEKVYLFQGEHAADVSDDDDDGLLLGDSIPLREQAFQECWQKYQRCIDTILENKNQSVLDDVISFVSSSLEESATDQIPAAFVVAGAGVSSQKQFFKSLSDQLSHPKSYHLVSVSAGSSPNLKAFLKRIITDVTSSADDYANGDEVEVFSGRDVSLLNYDLRIMHDWAKRNEKECILVAFEDSEAFDSSLLSDIIDLFSSWSDRQSFAILFGIATTAESFCDKLPFSATQALDARVFELIKPQALIEEFVGAIIDRDDILPKLGPGVLGTLVSWQAQHTFSIQIIFDAFRFSCLSHFMANPLSALCRADLTPSDLSKDHFDALRNVSSFRRLVEALLEQREVLPAKALLKSNTTLFEHAREGVKESCYALSQIGLATKAIFSLQTCLNKSHHRTLSSLYIDALGSDFASSPFVRELLLTIKKLSSSAAMPVLESVSVIIAQMEDEGLQTAHESLLTFVTDASGSSKPLRSEFSITGETLRISVVSRRAGIHSQKSTLSDEESNYSKLLLAFHNAVHQYLESVFVDPKLLSFAEVIMFDYRAMHRAAFMPRTRQVIDRALASPYDYLNCECCQDTQTALSSTQPDTSILYRLCLESGQLINMADLLSAFENVKGDNEGDDKDTSASFQQALAELLYLGIVKGTRKRVDHIARGVWNGL